MSNIGKVPPTRRTGLCGVPYEITEQDGQVIFEEKSGFYGCQSRFVFEWRGCGWYLMGYEDTFDQIYVDHIVAARKWVEENYTITWDNGTGTASMKPEDTK